MASTLNFDPRPRRPADERPTETLGAPDLRGAIPHARRLLGDRGTLARVAIAVCLGVSSIWAWRSYGGHGPAREQTVAPTVETSVQPRAQAASIAPSTTMPASEPSTALADHQQIETMARDLAALHQTVQHLASDREQLARRIDKLQVTRELAKLQTEKPRADKPSAEKPDARVLRRVSAHPATPVAAPIRKPAPATPTSPQAALQDSPLPLLSPPPQTASQIPSVPQP